MKKRKGILLLLFALGLCAYWELSKRRSSYCVIPIVGLSDYQIPCTTIEIEGNKYLVEIDLGAKTALALKKDSLEKLTKNECGVLRSVDFRGNKYESSLYEVSDIKCGEFFSKKVKVKVESEAFAAEGTVISKAKNVPEVGRIGRDFFKQENLFMDFRQGIFVICDDLNSLRERGVQIEDLKPIAFENNSYGVVLEVTTDWGKRKLVLDTGATISVLRSDVEQQSGIQVEHTTLFKMGGVDMGERDLSLMPISQDLGEIDGFLGMDFLKEHRIFLDFSKQTAYIGKSPFKKNLDLY